jgi:molybdopterin/thiamine biosynthesis adenylyltransferase
MAVAAWEAQEVVKILTGRGEPLRNRLLVIDMESGTAQTLQLG